MIVNDVLCDLVQILNKELFTFKPSDGLTVNKRMQFYLHPQERAVHTTTTATKPTHPQ